MKNKLHFPSVLALFSLLFFIGCSDDDETPVVDSTPEFAALESEVSTLPGEPFLFQGTFNDPAGIKSVNLKYEPWFLDKTIVKDSLPTSYELGYSFLVPADAEKNSTHVIPVTVTNAGNVTSTQEVTIALDLDNVAPTLTIDDPIDGATVIIGDGNEINLSITVEDEELAELSIESDLLNETLDASGASFNYENSLNVEEPGDYVFTITVTDASENSTVQSVMVSVVDELRFQNMFLVDSNEAASFEAALAGYPFAGTGSTELDEEGYVFSFRYYAEAEGAQVYFVAQRTSFSPFAFGIDPDIEGQLFVGSDASVSPIVLGAAGYYEITMDLRDLTFTTTQLTPPEPMAMDENFTGVYVTGTGLLVEGTAVEAYDPTQSVALLVDPENPFRYSGTIEFNAEDGSFIFVGNQLNYNVFWRVNNGPITTTDAIVPGGGTECVFETQYEGSYTLTVDLFLNTLEIISQ